MTFTLDLTGFVIVIIQFVLRYSKINKGASVKTGVLAVKDFYSLNPSNIHPKYTRQVLGRVLICPYGC